MGPGRGEGKGGAGRLWLALAALVWAALLGLVCVRGWLAPDVHTCYPFYETAGRRWLRGEDLYQELHATCRYSPLVHSLFAPLSRLPARAGGVAWRLVNAGAYLGGLAAWLRVVAPHWTAARRGLLWLLVVPLSVSTLNCAQASPLLIGLMLAGTAAAGAGRWNLAAALVAGACLLKVYPVALALLLGVTHPRRFAPRCLAALAVGLALPFLLQDPGYVARQYGNWWVSLCIDDRTKWSTDISYRDLWLFIRAYRLPP
jgi:hypothetical protein